MKGFYIRKRIKDYKSLNSWEKMLQRGREHEHWFKFFQDSNNKFRSYLRTYRAWKANGGRDYVILCDWCLKSFRTWGNDLSPEQIREEAQRYNWRYRSGFDLCPKHSGDDILRILTGGDK